MEYNPSSTPAPQLDTNPSISHTFHRRFIIASQIICNVCIMTTSDHSTKLLNRLILFGILPILEIALTLPRAVFRNPNPNQ